MCSVFDALRGGAVTVTFRLPRLAFQLQLTQPNLTCSRRLLMIGMCLLQSLRWSVRSKSLEGFTVHEPRNTMIRRRDLLLAVSGVAAVASVASLGATRSEAVVRRDKRRPQYQANSPEVQTFYRVNRYPGNE
jgi:hypothetical protein